jgi:hypothetical protein
MMHPYGHSCDAILWEYSYKGLKVAQLPGQLGVCLTFRSCGKRSMSLAATRVTARVRNRRF